MQRHGRVGGTFIKSLFVSWSCSQKHSSPQLPVDVLDYGDRQRTTMLNLLVAFLLVASAAGVPRSRGDPVHRSIQAQSGGAFQYNQNAAVHNFPPAVQGRFDGAFQQAPSPTPHVGPVPLNRNEPGPVSPQSQATGATFQVDPNTFRATQVVQPGPIISINPAPQTLQNPSVYQAIQGQQNLQNPSVYQAVQGQQNYPVATPLLPTFQSPPVPEAIPFQQTNQIPQVPITFPGQPTVQRPDQHGIRDSLSPSSEIAKRLIGNPPGGALLVGTNPPLFPIEKRLISNYTKLRPVVTDTFRCDKSNQANYVGYGYYADVDNDCQIFHVCLPWKDLYPNTFDTDVTYQFSFICPNQTVFSQDVLTCTWKSEAIPCAESPHLYWMNNNFFRKVNRTDGFGERYAHVNEKLEYPLKYDYDDFNP